MCVCVCVIATWHTESVFPQISLVMSFNNKWWVLCHLNDYSENYFYLYLPNIIMWKKAKCNSKDRTLPTAIKNMPLFGHVVWHWNVELFWVIRRCLYLSTNNQCSIEKKHYDLQYRSVLKMSFIVFPLAFYKVNMELSSLVTEVVCIDKKLVWKYDCLQLKTDHQNIFIMWLFNNRSFFLW